MKTKLATGLMILAMVVVAIGVVSALSNFDMQPPGGMQEGTQFHGGRQPLEDVRPNMLLVNIKDYAGAHLESVFPLYVRLSPYVYSGVVWDITRFV
jgi:hypothetical protein